MTIELYGKTYRKVPNVSQGRGYWEEWNGKSWVVVQDLKRRKMCEVEFLLRYHREALADKESVLYQRYKKNLL